MSKLWNEERSDTLGDTQTRPDTPDTDSAESDR